jgi:beta-glucosidase
MSLQMHTALIPSCSQGLSYTTFNYTDLTLSTPTYTPTDIALTATVSLTNTGSVSGSETVQLYVTLPATSELTHPPLQLKAFAKVKDLAPGQTERVTLRLDKYAVSYWEERIRRWVVEKGEYIVRVGASSAPQDLTLEARLVLQKGFEWNGL